MTIGSAMGMGMASAFCGIDIAEITEMLTAAGAEWDICSLRAMNSANQVFGFLGAALLFAVIFGSKSVNGFLMRRPAWTVAFVPLLSMFSFSLINASYVVNGWLIPEGSWIEAIAKPLEEQAEAMTLSMLAGTEMSDLYLNLLMVAVLPAICEEFVFRGVLQPLIAKASKNVHVGVWVSAFLFSFIHFQFFGFIPRMLIGVFLGYLVVHMASIWPAVLAHFLNNASAVVGYFLVNRGDFPSMGDLEDQSMNPYTVLLSAIFFTLLIWIVLQRSSWSKIKDEYLSSPKAEFKASTLQTGDQPES